MCGLAVVVVFDARSIIQVRKSLKVDSFIWKFQMKESTFGDVAVAAVVAPTC